MFIAGVAKALQTINAAAVDDVRKLMICDCENKLRSAHDEPSSAESVAALLTALSWSEDVKGVNMGPICKIFRFVGLLLKINI